MIKSKSYSFLFLIVLVFVFCGCNRQNLESLKSENFSSEYRVAVVVNPLRYENWGMDTHFKKGPLEIWAKKFLEKTLPSNAQIVQPPDLGDLTHSDFENKLIAEERFRTFDGIFIIQFQTDNPHPRTPTNFNSSAPRSFKDLGVDLMFDTTKYLISGPEPTYGYYSHTWIKSSFYSLKEKRFLYKRQDRSTCDLQEGEHSNNHCMIDHFKEIGIPFKTYLEAAKNSKGRLE